MVRYSCIAIAFLLSRVTSRLSHTSPAADSVMSDLALKSVPEYRVNCQVTESESSGSGTIYDQFQNLRVFDVCNCVFFREILKGNSNNFFFLGSTGSALWRETKGTSVVTADYKSVSKLE